jgi:hypothetical protein
MTDPLPEPLQSNRNVLLRAFVFLGAIAGTVFYIGIWHWVWSIPNNRRDGFELIAPFLGTIYFVLFAAPSWYFAIKNYALGIAAVFSAIALFVALYWFPWQVFSGTG